MPEHDVVEEIRDRGFSVLRRHFSVAAIDACREAFWPVLVDHVANSEPNRGTLRHFLPVPFEPPIFALEFFFDETVLRIARALMDDRIVIDQWGCDVPLKGSDYQAPHVDFRRPLFSEFPDLQLPPHALVVSFGLLRIDAENGAIEIAAGSHRLTRADAAVAIETGVRPLEPVELEAGDVLIRHPWAVHRGTPNRTDAPRALLSLRFVRRWYVDDSRETCAIPSHVWTTLTLDQQRLLRFPVAG